MRCGRSDLAIYADKKNGVLTGRWRVEVTLGGRRLRDRCNTHAEALAKQKEFIGLLERGEAPQAKRKFDADRTRPETLGEATKKAQGRLWRGKASEVTAFAHLRIIKELMGDPKLDAIDTEFIDDLIDALSASGSKDTTVNRYLSHFRSLLDWCKQRGYRTKELPTFAWKDEDEGRIRWITEREEAELQRLLDPTVWKVVRIAIRSGMRRGELLSVEPDQISPGWVHLWETKSGTPRSVPLTKEDEEDLRWLAGGNMPTQVRLRAEWDRARKAMGLSKDPNFVFHACRHTCATRLVQKNVNLRVIQKFLGHKRIETTLRYAHVNDLLLTNALEVLMGAPVLPAVPDEVSLAA